MLPIVTASVPRPIIGCEPCTAPRVSVAWSVIRLSVETVGLLYRVLINRAREIVPRKAAFGQHAVIPGQVTYADGDLSSRNRGSCDPVLHHWRRYGFRESGLRS